MNRTCIAIATVLAACGGAPAPDLSSWNAQVSELRARTTSYRNQPTAGFDPANCADELQRYRADVVPMLERMRDLGRDMDGCMRAMGHGAEADLAGTCASMDDELARYARAGCASADPSQNQARAFEHCDRMLGYLDHAQDGSTALGAMAGGDMMSGGSCHR